MTLPVLSTQRRTGRITPDTAAHVHRRAGSASGGPLTADELCRLLPLGDHVVIAFLALGAGLLLGKLLVLPGHVSLVFRLRLPGLALLDGTHDAHAGAGHRGRDADCHQSPCAERHVYTSPKSTSAMMATTRNGMGLSCISHRDVSASCPDGRLISILPLKG